MRNRFALCCALVLLVLGCTTMAMYFSGEMSKANSNMLFTPLALLTISRLTLSNALRTSPSNRNSTRMKEIASISETCFVGTLLFIAVIYLTGIDLGTSSMTMFVLATGGCFAGMALRPLIKRFGSVQMEETATEEPSCVTT